MQVNFLAISYVKLEPIEHALSIFFAKGGVCAFAKTVGTPGKPHQFDGFALAFEGDEELFALLNGAAIVHFTVHEQYRGFYIGRIGER